MVGSHTFTVPIRILHVDIEGGWGGSSRSLFELVSRLPRPAFAPIVAHRQRGPIVERYAALGIETVHVPEIATYVPRQRGALRNLALKLPDMARLRRGAIKLAAIARERGIDVVHLNYEGLYLLGRMLKSRGSPPIIVHCRSSGTSEDWIGRHVARTLAQIADQLFFISPNEQAWFRRCAPAASVAAEVMWNIAAQPLARAPFADPPEAVYLGSLDRSKGTDRLIDIGRALERMAAPPLTIAVWGEARNWPAYAAELQAQVLAQGLSRRIAFRGHTSAPERVLARAMALIRPSRTQDPWGRDVIEAARAGVPALATGCYQGVVRHNATGFLFPEFDAVAMAKTLVELLQDRERWRRMSAAAASLGAGQFGGEQQVDRFATVTRGLSARGRAGAAQRPRLDVS